LIGSAGLKSSSIISDSGAYLVAERKPPFRQNSNIGIRNSKQIRILNVRMIKTNSLKTLYFCHCRIYGFGHCFVFRASDFGFPDRKTWFSARHYLCLNSLRIISTARLGVTTWIFSKFSRSRRCLSPETIKGAAVSMASARNRLSKGSASITDGTDAGSGTS
jgi:hypothetical protein